MSSPTSEYSVSLAAGSLSSPESLEGGFDASRVMCTFKLLPGCGSLIHYFRPTNDLCWYAHTLHSILIVLTLIQDIPRVKEMHHDLFKTSSTLAALRQTLSLSHRRTFIAFLPPTPRHRTLPLIIGFSSAHITEHTPSIPPEITILAVGVEPLYRKHGVGENLVKAVCGSLLMSFTKRLTDGSALVNVEVRKGGSDGYFEKLGWEREELARMGLPWGE